MVRVVARWWLALVLGLMSPLVARGIAIDECLDAMTELVHPELQVFRSRYLSYRSGADNAAFIRALHDGLPKGMVFFHVENAVLKLLNDRYVRDKSLTGAMESLYTKLFFDNLQAAARTDRELQPALTYSDYKTIRLGFRNPSPQLAQKLAQIHERTARQFTETLAEYPTLQRLFSGAGGISGRPTAWHMAGFGRTPGEAATLARLARYDYAPGTDFMPMYVHTDAAHQRKLNDGVHRVIAMRGEAQSSLEAILGADTPLLTRPDPARREAVLSVEFLDILRRFSAENDADFLQHARQALERRFGLRIREQDSEAFQNALLQAREYFRTIDHFAPSIYESGETMDLGLGLADRGVVTVDLAGQNARNIHHTMLALHTAMITPREAGTSLAEHAMVLARRGQDRASADFDVRREAFNNAITRLGLPGEVRMSGDDGVFRPGRALTPDEKFAIVTALAEGSRASDYRLVFVPPHYEGTTNPISSRRRAGFAAAGENIEKNLRLALEGQHVPFAELRQVLIAIDFVPREQGGGRVNVLLGGRVTPEIAERVRTVLEGMLPQNYQIGTVRTPPARTGWNYRRSLKFAA